MRSTVRRFISLTVVLAAVVAIAPSVSLAVVAQADPSAPSTSGGVTVQQTPVRTGSAITAAKAVQPFRTVAVTWPAGATDVVARVRVEQDGVWTPWQTLDAADESTADKTDATGRAGSDPLWVDRADGVEASVTSGGTAVPDARVVTIDPGTRPDDDPARLDAASTPAATTTATTMASSNKAPYPMPRIITRKGWGADERLRATNGAECTKPDYMDTIRVAVVHHTAGSNSYTASQSAAIIRSVYAYHVKGRGWCDIGYNFLIDRYGRTFEGRYGGMHVPVRGAHAGGAYNTNTFGVSLMGSFDKQAPPATMMAATARLIAWKLDMNYRGPYSTAKVGTKTLNAIAGHRDVKATECPGRFVYARLPGLRKLVSSLMGGSIGTPIRDLAQRMGGEAAIGPAYWGEHPEGPGRGTWFARRDIYWSPRTGAHSLQGALRTEYRLTKHGDGPVGYPLEEQHYAAVPGAVVQHFLGADGHAAALYSASATGANPVYGVIMRAYAAVGAERSRLRLPVGGPYRVTGGIAQNFQGGRIMWNATTGHYTLS